MTHLFCLLLVILLGFYGFRAFLFWEYGSLFETLSDTLSVKLVLEYNNKYGKHIHYLRWVNPRTGEVVGNSPIVPPGWFSRALYYSKVHGKPWQYVKLVDESQIPYRVQEYGL